MRTLGKLLTILGIILMLFIKSGSPKAKLAKETHSPMDRMEVNKQSNWPVFAGAIVVSVGIFLVTAATVKDIPNPPKMAFLP